MAASLPLVTVVTVMVALTAMISFTNAGPDSELYAVQLQLQNSVDCQKDSNITFPAALTLQSLLTDPGNITDCTGYKDQISSVLTILQTMSVSFPPNGLFGDVLFFEDETCTLPVKMNYTQPPSGQPPRFTELYALSRICILPAYAQISWEDPRDISFNVFTPGPSYCDLTTTEFFQYQLTIGLCSTAIPHSQSNCPISGCTGSIQNTVMAGVGSLIACVGSCPPS